MAEGIDPLVIDLDRDGVELTRFDYSSARFELLGNLDFDAQADRVFAPEAATLSNAFSAVIEALPADPAAAVANDNRCSATLLCIAA